MTEDLCRMLVESFLGSSWPCVKTIVEKLASFKEEKNGKPVAMFRFKNGSRVNSTFEGNRFFLRSSVEYSNPQLTVEEVQGIIGARMLEACGNYFHDYGLHKPDANDVAQICEALKKPPQGPIIPFLLNTDDTEPDRYSMNPLRESIVTSGQSAFPAAYVKTESLMVDQQFVNKYEGTLISKSEAALVNHYLESARGSYLDLVDSVKCAQMENLSEAFGIDLSLYALRMPLATLQAEAKDGLLHHIISETHRDYEAVKQAYDCMGRSMANRTTLLTVPHSKKGYGSKRAARGKIHFNEAKLESVSVKYRTTRLYPNAIDPDDASIAQAEDDFEVTGEKLADYSFSETPSSPQFFLYSLGSPENAALWHGIGAFASPQLLRSYASARVACSKGQLIKDLKERYGVSTEVPLQFNLAPEGMWVHPVHRNIDASIGCVENPADLARMGMKIEYLSAFK
ncbi:MAG TPA: hypothetical protein VI864_05130 [Candidatus Bathyarchaeia archaeon]|nr:hypothetical protein [Candidatus Bathyarchaeia archaeon]